jgi:hypothetical protein
MKYGAKLFITEFVKQVSHPENCQCISCADRKLFASSVIDRFDEKLVKKDDFKERIKTSKEKDDILRKIPKKSLFDSIKEEILIYYLDKFLIYLNGFGILFFMLKIIIGCIFDCFSFNTMIFNIISLILFVIMNKKILVKEQKNDIQ